MKTLLILRHAKSSWSEEDLSDHDRPLNKRGRHDAPKMGELIRKKGLQPQLIICSGAKRARETVELVTAACGIAPGLAVFAWLALAMPSRCVWAILAENALLAWVLLLAVISWSLLASYTCPANTAFPLTRCESKTSAITPPPPAR